MKPAAPRQITMLGQLYCWVMTRAEGVLHRLAATPAWLPRGVAVAIALSLLVTFPRISFFLGNDGQIVDFWPFVEQQARTPLTMRTSSYVVDESSHESKRMLRLTLPIIMRVLHADWRVMLVLQFALGVLMLYLVGRIAWELFADRVVALASVLGVSATYAGKAAFLQLGGIGDPFAYAFLTIATAFGNAPLIAVSVFAACFTDERAVIAAPLVGFYWAFRHKPAPSCLNRQTITVVLAITVALAARIYLMWAHDLHTPVGPGKDAGFDMLGQMLSRLQYTFPHVLAGLWLWPLIAAILLVKQRQWLAITAIGLAVAILTGVSMMVMDADRSLSYLLPLVYVAMAIAAAYRLSVANARSVAIAAMLVTLAFPVNSFFGSDTRYSSGNLLPVELVRFYSHLHRS